jgi:NADH-quinone oxidoreductase subunit J
MSHFFNTTLILNAIFFFSLATTVVGALIAVLSARLIRSVCGLAICCLGLSGLYYFLHSPFLALMEILIYIGAVCVTIVFAVMLVEPDEPASGEKRASALEWGGAMLAMMAGLFWALSRLVLGSAWSEPGAAMKESGSIRAIGLDLLTTYSMAFELISLALLVAIVGALAIARAGRTKP